MSDLRTMLHEAAGPLVTTDALAVADADLARGHRALRRRRAARLGAGSGLLAVAALGAFVLVSPTPGSTPVPAPAQAAPKVATSGIALVSYTGKQPVGYTLDKIPAGWEVKHSDASLLTLAPEDAKDTASAPGEPFSLIGTIAVMSEKDTGVPSGIPLDKIRVGDRPGVIAHMKGSGDTRTLFLKQPSGAYLVIQVWSGLGWDNDQIVEFASSVHITKDAELTAG
jgi:hypothetical protein